MMHPTMTSRGVAYVPSSSGDLQLLAMAVTVISLSTASAQANLMRVTGEQTTITPSAQATQFHAENQVTVNAPGRRSDR